VDLDTGLPDGWDGVYVLRGPCGPIRVYKDGDKAEADREMLEKEGSEKFYVSPCPLVP